MRREANARDNAGFHQATPALSRRERELGALSEHNETRGNFAFVKPQVFIIPRSAVRQRVEPR